MTIRADGRGGLRRGLPGVARNVPEALPEIRDARTRPTSSAMRGLGSAATARVGVVDTTRPLARTAAGARGNPHRA